MVARLCRGAISADRADEHLPTLVRAWVRNCADSTGNRGIGVLRRVQGEFVEFILISLWDSLDSTQGFAIRNAAGTECPLEKSDLPADKPTIEQFEVLSFKVDRGETCTTHVLERFMLLPLG